MAIYRQKSRGSNRGAGGAGKAGALIGTFFNRGLRLRMIVNYARALA